MTPNIILPVQLFLAKGHVGDIEKPAMYLLRALIISLLTNINIKIYTCWWILMVTTIPIMRMVMIPMIIMCFVTA
jgi:hypothetical protein